MYGVVAGDCRDGPASPDDEVAGRGEKVGAPARRESFDFAFASLRPEERSAWTMSYSALATEARRTVSQSSSDMMLNRTCPPALLAA